MSAAAAAAAAAVVTRPYHSSAPRSSFSSSSSYYNGDFNQERNRYNNAHTYPFGQAARTLEDDYYDELYRNTAVLKQLRSLEVSIAELQNLPATSQTVYQRNGNLYYRTSTQKALANEQSTKANLEQHALARANLQPYQQPSGGNN